MVRQPSILSNGLVGPLILGDHLIGGNDRDHFRRGRLIEMKRLANIERSLPVFVSLT
jgi:hypothetical protein